MRALVGYPKVSNVSAVWTPSLQEVLINGVQQGKKNLDLAGASALSRSKMATLVLSCVTALRLIPTELSEDLTYSELKALDLSQERKNVKREMIQHGLCNWVGNWVDDFSILQ